jgi:hypothetical protein
MKHTDTSTTRFAISICTLAIFSFFLVDPATGQFVEEWEKSEKDGNRPTYISDGNYNARGLAYGMVDDGNGTMVERVFVASNANGPYRIYVVDPSDGALLDSLDVSGIEQDGFRFLNDVGVSEDGKIFACNAARLTQTFYCFRWDTLADSPTTVVSGLNTDARVGSNISVTGSTADNSLLIHTADVTADTLFQIESDFSVTRRRTPAEGSTPNVEDAYPAPGGGFYHTWINEPAQQYDASDTETGQIPTGVADSLVSLTIFEAGGETFLAGAKNDYAGDAGANDRARLANITDGADNATMYGETPSLGSTTQFQGNGDVDVRVNNDGTVTLFYLATNNGIAAFTTTAAPLPVELSGFSAEQIRSGAVQLTWTTVSETNNAGFRIQHQQGDADWADLGYVESKAEGGTTTEAQVYRFAVEDLSPGTHRFRLKQQDLDGGETVSETVEVSVIPEGAIAIQGVAPNPVRGLGTLRFTARESGTVSVALYDALGRKVKMLHEGRVSGGQPKQVTVDATTLSSGVYFLRVKGDDFSKTRRVTVMQ